MKTVFPTANVAHVFANETQDNGRNPQGNFYFNGGIIFSYRDSYPLAVLTPFKDEDGARVAIVNGATYSVTTSRHSSHVRDALRNGPFHVVTVPRAFDNYDARSLENGKPEELQTLAEQCANEARADFSQALRKRDPWRAAYALDSAARNFANAQTLVSLIPDASKRRKARAAVGKLPASFPADYRDDSGAISGDLIATLADARREQSAAEAVAKMATAISNARGYWKAARDPVNSAEIRRIRAKSAIDSLKSAAIFAKRCARKLPRGLPSIASVDKYRDGLAPLEMVQRLDRNRVMLVEARNVAAADYFTAMRALRNGTSRAPAALRRALGNVGNMRSPVKTVNAAQTVINGGFNPDAATDKNKAVRAAYAALHSECVATVATLGNIARRCEAMHARDELQDAQDAANEDAANGTNNPVTLAHMLRRMEQAESMRFAAPELAREIVVTYSAEDLQAIRCRFAVATYANRATALQSATARAATMATQAIQCDARQAYTAVRDAESAAVALQTARDVAAIMEKLRADGNIAETEAQREARESLASIAEMVTRAAAYAASLECDAVTAWRNRDAAAPRPSGTYFRLSSDGQEIESSRGARVSIEAGARLWRMIRVAVDRNAPQSWAHGAGPAVGPFRAIAINADGSAVIGCHTITATEARAFATFMQWPPFDVARAA